MAYEDNIKSKCRLESYFIHFMGKKILAEIIITTLMLKVWLYKILW